MVDGSFIAAIAEFDRLPIAGGVFTLDGTILAVNRAATKLLARPAQELVDHKAWEFAPGADLIWEDVLVIARRRGEYLGNFTLATPEGPRGIRYVATIREHADRAVVLLFALDDDSEY